MKNGNSTILGQLGPEILLNCYANGIFPMVEDGQLYWFSPDPRGVLPMDGSLHVPRRLRRTLRGPKFQTTRNVCFERVMRCCATCGTGRDQGTWISPEMISAYAQLHELGFAVSFETWHAGRVDDGNPVGGLYGVAIGKAFFGESMFHTVTDAGKMALVRSVEFLRQEGFRLYDIQWTTPNLKRYGAYEISRHEYLRRLAEATKPALQE
ncbi:MAG: leucyl/phenylalanyl-tRNA--protein transferase [Phycisphaerae bacterium]